ncbi:TonB-dependent receptor [Sphingobacterium sp. LRF_L2]|uniref:TonB-dependent receptor n=1 Tax=Sphingobacterium sp. LRF_L2 TaxID=3369421 RepID=UPI003F62E7C0
MRGVAFFFFLLFFFANTGFGQTNLKRLVDVLPVLEKNYKLSFSFLDKEVKDVLIDVPALTQSKEVLLKELTRQTGLVFTLLTDSYVVIHKQTNPMLVFCGFIKDAESNRPVAHASVYSANGESTYADESGYFSLTVPRGNTCVISHVGYKQQAVIATAESQSGCMSLFLERKVTRMEEIAVNHFLTKGLHIKTDRSYHMNPKQTGLLPGLTDPDVLQTLQQLPGIVSIDQSVSNISVRAGSHDQNLFVWNGVRLFQTGHFFGLISAFNPNLPHAVTIYKNGTPASYGESVSGTILIDSRPDSLQQKERSSIGLSLINADFNTSFRTSPKTYWQFSGRRSITDVFRSPVYKKYHERVFQNTKVTNFFADQSLDYTSTEDFRFHDFTAQLKQYLDNGSALSVNAIVIANNLEVTQRSNQDSTAETSQLAQNSIAANLIYDKKWDDRQQSKIQASLSHYKLSSEDFNIDDDNVSLQQNVVMDKGLVVNHEMKLSDVVDLSIDYQMQDIAVKNDNERTSLLSQSLAVQFNGRYDRFYFSTGIRNHHFISYRKFRPEPRLVVSYHWREPWTITFAGELKSQTAFQEIERQQDFFGIETRRWKLANEQDVPFLKSSQAALEIQFKKGGWLITTESFIKNVRDIHSGSQGFQNQFSNSNVIGDYTVRGVEFQLQKQRGPFTAWINFHINKSEYYFESLNPKAFRNNYETPYALRWGLIYNGERWEAALGGIWTAGRYYTQPSTRIPAIAEDGSLFINYDEPNKSQLEGNFQLNISCSRSIYVKKRFRLKSGFAVQNIFNTSTVINRNYRINSNNEMIEEIDNYSLARTANIFVRAYF